MRAKSLFCAACLIVVAGCTHPRLASKPGVYTVTVQPVHTAHNEIHATYVRPLTSQHSGYLVVFATGDDGWFGTSRALFVHLAERGYTLAGFSAPEALRDIVQSDQRIGTGEAAQALKELYAQAKRHLGLTDSTPIIMVGFSRGASAVAFTAVHPELRDGIVGAVAIALTREADYLRASEGEHRPEIQVDDQDRIQLYPALKLLGATRLAVIQSTHDSYVPSAESRQLLGPDTETLRLYQVDAEDHGFSNARDTLMQDLDDALRWIEQTTTSAS
ncbi:MAG: alpha/beta hydrolase family protein [Povalibacter sp.]